MATSLKPSQQVVDLCEELGLGCRPHPDVPDEDWQTWLDGFELPTGHGDCPECDGQLVERSGKYGQFLGCSNYSDCRYTEDAS